MLRYLLYSIPRPFLKASQVCHLVSYDPLYPAYPTHPLVYLDYCHACRIVRAGSMT